MTHELTDADREQLQRIRAAHKQQGAASGTDPVAYADRPRVQARVLWVMRDARSPCKAGDLAADDRLDHPPCEVGKCLSTLADQDIVERVRYSNGSYWWREVA